MVGRETPNGKMQLGWACRRLLFALLTAWLVVTLAFGFIALTTDPGEAAIAYGIGSELAGTGLSADEIDAEIDAAVAEYRADRDLDRPTHQVYLEWAAGILNGDWGHSHTYGESVESLIIDRLLITAAYAVPAMALAVIGGVALGSYAALAQRTSIARVITGSAYAVYGIPNFWIAAVIVIEIPVQYRMFVLSYDTGGPLYEPTNLVLLLLASVVLGSGLIAGQARYVRNEVIEVGHHPFVRTHRALGGSRMRLLYKILRVAAIPLSTLFFSTLLGVLVLNVVVIEYVFDIPGFGTLMYQAILDHDLPLVVGTTMVVAFIGIGGTLGCDLTRGVLDPRVRTGDR